MQVIEKVKVVPEGYNGAGMKRELSSDSSIFYLSKF